MVAAAAAVSVVELELVAAAEAAVVAVAPVAAEGIASDCVGSPFQVMPPPMDPCSVSDFVQ